MPRRCMAAGCDTKSEMGYSLHGFPRDKVLQKAVKRPRSNWESPSSSSQLCSKHFEDHCFVTEGVCYLEAMGVLTVKWLKPDTVPTIFPRSIDYLESTSSTPTSLLLSDQQKQKSVSMLRMYLYVATSDKLASYSWFSYVAIACYVTTRMHQYNFNCI